MALLSPSPKFNALSSAGVLGAGYRLYTYLSGTTTPAATYSNRAGSVANTNPVILDARGEAVIFLTAGTAYRYVLKTDLDVQVWSQDEIEGDALGADLATSNGSALVGFLQAGVGAVLRTLGNKGKERISAWDFMSDAERSDVLLVAPTLDHTASLQKAIDAQTISLLKDSARLHLPFGNYRISSELVVRFNGVFYGDGVDCTTITLLNATQNGIRVPYSGTLQVHGFRIKAGVTKTAGAGIKLDGINSTNATNQTRIFNMKIDQQYTGIDMANSGFWSIRDTVISDAFIGIRSDNTQNYDGGDNVIGEGTVIYRTGADSTSGTRGVLHVASGGLKLIGVKILGYDYGYALIPRSGATAMVDTQIIGCSMEFQNDCIHLETNTGSTGISQFVLSGNQLAPKVNGILMRGNIGAGAITGGQISLNFTNNCGIRFATDGTTLPGGVNVTGVQMSGNSSSGSIGIHGGFAAKANNNAVSGNLISGVVTEIVGFLGRQRDVTYTAAAMPSDATNGSLVYVSDGTAATPPGSGGTGCFARRTNGAWVGF